MLLAIQRDWTRMHFVGKRLRDDRDFVLAAVQLNGHALCGVKPEFQNDREIVIAAIQQYPDAKHFASAELRIELGLV